LTRMVWTKIYQGEAPQRINKWLAQAGVCSRRDAEALIAQGLVSIDGDVVAEPGRKIAQGQTLTLADAATAALGAAATFVINKPVGYVSAQPEHGQVPAARLLSPANAANEKAQAPALDRMLAPLGRLDLDSRGLLLLSDDGVLAKAVIGPDSQIDKEYLVRVKGDLTPRKIALLRHGLSLDGRVLKPAKVDEVEPARLRFVLREGRNRQIRRMCEAVELDVEDLLRVRIGAVRLDSLKEGTWRILSTQERDSLLVRGV